MSTFFTYCCVIDEPPCGVAADHVLVQCRANGALDVDAAVLVEPRVFAGDRGILHVLADRLERDLFAVLVEEGREELRRAVGLRGVDVGLLREGVDVEEPRKVLEHRDAVVRGHAGDGEGGRHGCCHEHAGESAHADDAENPGTEVAHRTFLGRHIVERNGDCWQIPIRAGHAAFRRDADPRVIRIPATRGSARHPFPSRRHQRHQRRGVPCPPGSTSPPPCSSTTPPRS